MTSKTRQRDSGNDSAVPPIGIGPVAARLTGIALLLARRLIVLLWWRVRRTKRGQEQQRASDTWLLDTITALGPAFIKVAQMLSTRADLLPPQHCRALAALHDDVPPIPPGDLATVLTDELGAPAACPIIEQVESDGGPVAAGSIACVYRTTLPDGSDVAIKVRRPGIEAILRVDLTIMRYASRLLARLPGLRGVPVVEIIGQLGDAVYGQLDFDAERRNLALLRANLAGQPGIRVPDVREDMCTDGVLVMEFLPGLRRRTPSEMSADDRTGAVLAALRAVYQMLFHDGLVHCDLHPGNLYLGPASEATIVDAGFTVRLSQQAQDKFSAFFYAMSVGKGEKCAEIVLSTTTPGPATDVEGFRGDIAALISAHTGVMAVEFDLIHFATQLFDIQRRYGLYADPQFVFPILSLLVLEGAVRDFAPAIDFQDEAIPFLAGAMIARTLQIAREGAQ